MDKLKLSPCISMLIKIYGEGLIYIANRVVAHIPFHFVRLFFYRTCLGFKIGVGSTIFMDAWFDSQRFFSIGKNSTINQKCRLDNRGGLTIGDNVTISSEVCILTADHDLQSSNFEGRTRPVNIENYVFVGTRAMILPGVTLEEGSAVAAGAVVTRNVARFTIVAGVPARSIGKRCSNLHYSASYIRLFS